MRPIQDSRVLFSEGSWLAKCTCGFVRSYTTKAACLKMLYRGNCRSCKKYYSAIDSDVNIYQKEDGRWCSLCSGCGVEQAYTRKDHAKQSEISDWQCKKCVMRSRRFSKNKPVGDLNRLYNRFRKSANSRGINWNLSVGDLERCYSGYCALTGWQISMSNHDCTASLDRIDSKKAYEIDNIQWVHSMVNMAKNKYSQKDFIQMCFSVSEFLKDKTEKHGIK